MIKYTVRLNDDTKQLEIEMTKSPMPYPEAAKLATKSARSDSDDFRRRSVFSRRGTAIN